LTAQGRRICFAHSINGQAMAKGPIKQRGFA
jgi:hypothetical protein